MKMAKKRKVQQVRQPRVRQAKKRPTDAPLSQDRTEYPVNVVEYRAWVHELLALMGVHHYDPNVIWDSYRSGLHPESCAITIRMENE